MRLKKAQKEKLIEWIAEGFRTDEINKRAGKFDPPFSVTRSQVMFYRRTRAIDIEAITKADENNALITGLALKEIRVLKLQQLAALLEKDLFGGFLWTENVKSIGSGTESQVVDYEEFNKAEVDAYRGVLEDIAKEVGGRKQELSGSIDLNFSKMSDDELRKYIQEAVRGIGAGDG